MHILITGAAGFLGSRLIRSLLAGPAGLLPISRILAADVASSPIDDGRVVHRIGTITNPDFVRSIVEPGLDIVYHLAAALSGQSEAEFDTGMQVNVDATRGSVAGDRASIASTRAPRMRSARSVVPANATSWRPT